MLLLTRMGLYFCQYGNRSLATLFLALLSTPVYPARRIGVPIEAVNHSHNLERFLSLMPGDYQFVACQSIVKDRIPGGKSNHLRGHKSQD